MDHRIIDSQRNWPYPVNDADSGQPSTWQGWGFDGQNNSYNNYAQLVEQNVYDEFIHGGAYASPETQVIKKEQGSVESDHDFQKGLHVASPPSLDDKRGNSLQDNIQSTSSPALDYAGSDCGQAAVSVNNKCDKTFKASPDSESRKELRPEPLQVPRPNQNMMSLAIGQGGNEHAKHPLDVKLEKSSSLVGSLLNTPAFQYDQGHQYFPWSMNFQPPFQSQNSTSRLHQQPILLPHGLIPAGSQQQTQNYLPQVYIPYTTALYNPTMPLAPNYNQQPILSRRSMTVAQIPIIRPEQVTRLQRDICHEVDLHLQIMTAYFTHTLKNLSKDVSPAAAQAKRHWLESAKVWLSTVPESWKSNLPVAQWPSQPVEEMLILKIYLQRLIEAARRQKLVNQVWPHNPDEWRQDINFTAHREELKLMKTWTSMFKGMLQDLRSKFPLLEDALQEIRVGGGRDQLLDGDGVKMETDQGP